MAGARAVTGTVSPLLLIVMIVAGMVIGNAAWFAAGRRYGSAVLKLLCRVSISPDTCVARTEDVRTLGLVRARDRTHLV